MTELAIIVALVVANGAFAGAEIAVLSVRHARLRAIAQAGGPAAAALVWLRAHPERFLATVQIAITVIGATAAAFGGATLAARIAPRLGRLGLSPALADEIAMVAVVALVSALSIVLGELVPKSLALRASERYALRMSRALRLIASAARPLVWLLTAASNVVLRPFGDRTTFSEARVSLEELRHLVDEATQSGAIDAGSGDIASRALGFGQLRVGSVMVPRPRIVALDRDAGAVEVARTLVDSGRSRMPVYAGRVDEVVGYVTARDLHAALMAGQLRRAADVVRPTLFVPPTSKAIDVLRELQRRQMHLAIVVDEHGGMAGMITVNDLVEELVGEVLAEHDRPARRVVWESDDTALVDGATPVRDLNRQLRLELPETGRGVTVAGLCLAQFGVIPVAGDRFVTTGGVAVEVVGATPSEVTRVRLRLPARDAPT